MELVTEGMDINRLTREDIEAISLRMREGAEVEYANRISIENLTPEHHSILVHAIRNVLSTELAVFTYAQIMDGLPTGDVAWDKRSPGIEGDHPIDEEHETLCPGVLEKARDFQDNWSPADLKFKPEVLQAFQDADPNSKMFQNRLIELIAITVHQLAAALFKLDLRLHNGDVDRLVQWRMPSTGGSPSAIPRSTLFNHPAYLAEDVYPDGVADVVGYWAEDRILGGVVVFHRRAEARSPDSLPNVWLHSARRWVTNRPYELTDEQQQSLVEFLLAAAPTEESCPLPMLGEKRNRRRVDATMAITHYGVYRDIWERKPLTFDILLILERRPKEAVDYPEEEDLLWKINTEMFHLTPPNSGGPGEDGGRHQEAKKDSE